MTKEIFYSFVEAINKHDVDIICSLMTDGHKFIDSHGNEAVGKEMMKNGWTGYFQLFPDYTIEITGIFVNGDAAAAFGFAGGTYKGLKNDGGNYWRLPAAWKTVIHDGKIALWQVYADSKIPFDIITRNTRQ